MKLIGIDIGKNKHFFSILDKESGEVIVQPVLLLTIKKDLISLSKN